MRTKLLFIRYMQKFPALKKIKSNDFCAVYHEREGGREKEIERKSERDREGER